MLFPTCTFMLVLSPVVFILPRFLSFCVLFFSFPAFFFLLFHFKSPIFFDFFLGFPHAHWPCAVSRRSDHPFFSPPQHHPDFQTRSSRSLLCESSPPRLALSISYDGKPSVLRLFFNPAPSTPPPALTSVPPIIFFFEITSFYTVLHTRHWWLMIFCEVCLLLCFVFVLFCVLLVKQFPFPPPCNTFLFVVLPVSLHGYAFFFLPTNSCLVVILLFFWFNNLFSPFYSPFFFSHWSPASPWPPSPLLRYWSLRSF